MDDVQRRVEAVWRMESARILAVLHRMLGDLSLAEEMAQEALLKALERWPRDGLPDRPGAWLTTVAKNRAIDHLRRLKRQPKPLPASEEGEAMLDLILAACHPCLSREARVALTLRVVGGLTTAEIARAFLVPEATLAQRLVRAKRALAEQRLERPTPEQLDERLEDVLEVLYLIFNEGYSATAGEDWVRPELCQDAMRLGRMLAVLLPNHSETHALVALMELQASRLRARTNARGEPVLLLDQNRGQWDHLLIQRGLKALHKATRPGRYQLQARIAACHARARSADETDWTAIAALYTELARLTGSAVVEVNRAVALGMAGHPALGLQLVDELADDLRAYPPWAVARGDLLEKLGRPGEARAMFETAASLTGNAREREVLRRRVDQLSL